MAQFRGGYGPDARFLSEQDQSSLRLAEDSFSQQSSPDTRKDRARRRALSAKAAGAYRERQGYAQPNLGGRVSVGKFVLDASPFGGTELPSLRGRNYGRPGAGGKMYATKPQANFGMPY